MPLVGGAIAKGGSRTPVLLTQALLAFALPALVLAPDAYLFAPAIFLFGAMLGGHGRRDERQCGRHRKAARPGDHVVLPRLLVDPAGFTGAALGGPLIAAISPLGQALLAGLFALLMLWPLKRLMLDERATAGSDTPGEKGGLKALIGAASRDRRSLLTAVAIGFFALCAMVPEGAAIDWSAIYLRQDLGADIATSGFAFAGLFLRRWPSSAFPATPSATVSERWRRCACRW